MRIVPQSACVFYSPFPLLPAPAPRPLLPAPKIAGLLPARVNTDAAPFADTVLTRNDPTPAPFVSKDRAKLPPAVLKLIGHLPAPDELQHRHETRMREISEKWEARRRLYRENPEEFFRLFREYTR